MTLSGQFIGATLGLVVTVSAAMAYMVGDLATDQLRGRIGASLADLATEMADRLDREMAVRIAEVDVLANLPGLDGFKRINDIHNRAAGNRVLLAVAERLRRCVRVGVACFPSDARSLERKVMLADGASYEAKRAGKGRAVVRGSAVAAEQRSYLNSRPSQPCFFGVDVAAGRRDEAESIASR